MNQAPTQHTPVVLFEEHPLMILGIRTVLERGGATVVGAASDAGHLYELADELKPEIIVLDLAFYTPERFAFLHNLKEAHPGSALIVLSVHREESVASEAIKAGARAYLLKTEAPDNLLKAIEAIRMGGTYFSELVRPHGEPAEKSQPHTPIDLLTASELAVLQMVGKGFTLEKIAKETGRTREQVEADYASLREKLQLSEPEDLLEFAAHWVHHEGGFT